MKTHVSLLLLLTAVIGSGQQNVPFDKTFNVPVAPTGLANRKLPKLPMEFDTAEGQRIRVVAVTRALEYPFSAAFLPDGNMLVTERTGRLRIRPRLRELIQREIAVSAGIKQPQFRRVCS